MAERAHCPPAARDAARIGRSPAPPVPERAPRAAWDQAQQSLGNQGVLRSAPLDADSGGALVIVDDMVASVGPGQMRRAEFLTALQEAVFAAADPDLSRAGRTARDCPYIRSMFHFYNGRDAGHLRRALFRHAPETRWAGTAGDYIALVSERARHAAGVWAATGRIAWGPREFAAGDPGMVQAEMGPGVPLPGRIRAQAEAGMQEDFSGVRVHSGDAAGALSRRLEARAFTIGQDIAFAPGQYRPGTPEGDAILAHELAHVAQQRQGQAEAVPRDESAALERDADQAAAGTVLSIWAAAAGAARRVKPALRSGVRVQRCRDARAPRTPAAAGPLSFTSSEFVMDADGPVTITDQGATVAIQSTEVLSSGTVTASGGSDAEARDWKAGYLQTVFESHRVMEYVDSSGAHNNSFEVKLPGPTRDGTSEGAPWYSGGKPKATAGSPIPVSSGIVSRF
ncbi:MAG TPA: DUF4157 domain-containing protein, partial [Bryobacteraceae bacterium]|nr:DUF4157 domain-containing protein [Bryobacteraceae bacterium]